MRKPLLDGIMLIVIAGALLAWVNINHINSPHAFISYFDNLSHRAEKCVGKGSDPYAQCHGISIPSSSLGSSTPVVLHPTQLTAEQTSLSGIPTTSTPSTPPAPSTSPHPSHPNSYIPSQWPHWLGRPCDIGDQTLIAQGKNVKLAPSNKCQILSGQWTSPYDGKRETEPSQMSIDSIVPIKYAALNGADSWPVKEKEEFANDSTQLVAVSNASYTAKDGAAPAQWMPSNHRYDCEYSIVWIKILQKYKLPINKSNRHALSMGLKSCR